MLDRGNIHKSFSYLKRSYIIEKKIKANRNCTV